MNKTVKCAKLYGIGDLRYEEAPFPECGGDEVIVKVMSCGICGSDLGRVYVKGTYTFPTVIGHEFSGRVVFDPLGLMTNGGACVFPLLPCFKCKSCREGNYATCENYDYYGSRRDGGMTEYIAVKRWNLVKMPSGLSYDEGAMCEPDIGCETRRRKAEHIKRGERFYFGRGPYRSYSRAVGCAFRRKKSILYRYRQAKA